MSDEELEHFKREINLSEFAASRGYALDRRESSRNSAVMRHPNGDKIIISKGQSGDWIYFSVRDSGDNGSVIDFVQARTGETLGKVRKALREWRGGPRPPMPESSYLPNMAPLSHDRGKVLLAWQQATFQPAVPYLEGRGLDASFLANARFLERFRIDARGNVLFPHYDKDGLCGFEIKNHNFTGFAAGGVKGLWYSACKTGDQILVLAESAIDALSYAALHPDPAARYMSTGGKLNPDQPLLIRAALEKMPKGSRVILAFDNDKDGNKFAEQVKALVPSGLEVLRPLPPVGKDWNDALKNKLNINEVKP